MVSQNALVKRLRRKLAHEALRLRQERGAFSMLDSHNYTVGPLVDPARLALSLGLLHFGETATDLDGKLVRGRSFPPGITRSVEDALAEM